MRMDDFALIDLICKAPVSLDKKLEFLSNIFLNETDSNEPLQNSINMYKNDEIVSFNELPNKEEIAVIKTEKVAIKAIIIITL